MRLKAIGMPAGVDYTIQPSSVTVTLAGQGTTTRDVKVQVEGRRRTVIKQAPRCWTSPRCA
ncbi:hypothetical protein GCM10025857_17740 [Alicyclobacillus contaminans]|nr:hypothetical protein GCM10025857_17740 [Alicyclobacillus contaminans]